MWNIEKIVSKGDYDYAVVSNHPNATKNHYVLLHRIVMENHLGRLLEKGEVVHHINKNKKDNRLENLELKDKSQHVREHSLEHGRKWVRLKCPNCGQIFETQKRQSFLQKGSKYTCCSMKCRGQFSRKWQLYGYTTEALKAISENFIEEFVKYTPV